MRRLLLAPLLLAAAALPAGEAEEVARSLRDGKPPWYDAAADGWRRIEVREPSVEAAAERMHLPGAEYVAIILLGVLLVVVVAVLVWWLRQQRLPAHAALADAPGRAASRTVDLSGLPLPEAGLAPAEGLRRALAAGDMRAAVVWIHAGLLARLDEAGAVRLERSSTERQIAAAVRAWTAADRSRAPANEALARTAAAFAAVYFGHAPADRAQVEALLAAVGRAESAIGGGAA
jgi:hypothetical protein